MRPEILHLDSSHLVWRDLQCPAPGAPRRPVTWDILNLWLRAHWKGLFQPDVRDAVSRANPPLAGSDTIRHLNRPQELLQLSINHNLCLEKYIDPIIRGEYALYRIDHEGQFAIAGIKRTENGTWELDEIRGARNEEAPEQVRRHFNQWLVTGKNRVFSGLETALSIT